MANGKITLGKQSGGTLGLVFPDGVSNTEVVLPESGNIASVNTAVTDNAIARYDGTTGKLQNSGVVIDDSGNVGIGTNSPDSITGKMLHVYNNTNTGLVADNATLKLESANRDSAITLKSSGNGTISKVDYATNQPVCIMSFPSSGEFLQVLGKGIGYGAGAGGQVVQLTSKSTAVTLNKPCGVIIMNNAALAAGASVQFTVNNSKVTNADNVVLTNNWGAAYSIRVVDVNDGFFYVVVKNESAGSLSETVAFNFTIIKGAVA